MLLHDVIKPLESCDPPPMNDRTGFPRDRRERGDQRGQVFCVNRADDVQAENPIRVDIVQSKERVAGTEARVTTYSVTQDDQPVASYSVASIEVIAPSPVPFVGCFLIDNPSAWKCGAQFRPEWVTVPEQPSPDPAAIIGWLLHLPERTAGDRS